MRPERFELALERLAPEAWSSFERLASTFLAVDYPTLRTVASMSGDQDETHISLLLKTIQR
jgi:hypothetical protein